jgi:hypothetical protein
MRDQALDPRHRLMRDGSWRPFICVVVGPGSSAIQDLLGLDQRIRLTRFRTLGRQSRAALPGMEERNDADPL